MAAKRVDPLKAKAAKQKKIAIGLVVLLVAVLAIQGPKMLNMLKGPQPAAPAATGAGGPAKGGPAVGGPAVGGPAVGGPAVGGPAVGGPAAAPGTGATAAPADLASVPDSDQPPVVDDGQLATFERFSSKDPFAQQAEPVVTRPAAKKPSTTDAAVDPAKDPKPATDPTDGGFTTGGGTPSEAATLATATSIAVNGVAEDVKVDVPFPVAEPTFVLVSVAADGKSVQIGINGGGYASGGETLKLLLGKKLTLQNTADGSRYELELRSITGFPLPSRKG
jgi:hypothetical protein